METMTAVRSQTYQSHPLSERIRVVELYEQGLSSKRIARQLGLDDSMVCTDWKPCAPIGA